MLYGTKADKSKAVTYDKEELDYKFEHVTPDLPDIDDTPTANSNNLVKSGGVYSAIKASKNLPIANVTYDYSEIQVGGNGKNFGTGQYDLVHATVNHAEWGLYLVEVHCNLDLMDAEAENYHGLAEFNIYSSANGMGGRRNWKRVNVKEISMNGNTLMMTFTHSMNSSWGLWVRLANYSIDDGLLVSDLVLQTHRLGDGL